MLTVTGGLLLVFGLFLTTRLPLGFPIGVDLSSGVEWALFGTWIGSGLLLSYYGTALLGDAEKILGSFRWESEMVFVEAEGSFGRTEVKAGKGKDDSFETANVVVRCDGNVRVRTAKVLTETHPTARRTALEGPRWIVAMVTDEDAKQVHRLVESSVEAFDREGVNVRGLDLEAESVAETAQANVAYSKTKEQAVTEGRRDALEGGSETEFLGPDQDTPRFEAGPEADEAVGAGSEETSGASASPTSCPGCGDDVSRDVSFCPSCGAPIEL